MSQLSTDEKFMRRCLELASNGRQNAKPNPMVGAVIVDGNGRIIGEGYHERCGCGHAEVNAFASVRKEDEVLLSESTIYVSLEPCSHYGKTPPCAELIIRKGVRRVVCGCIDPFAKVQGRGVQMIRDAGIEVTVGVLEKECLELNRTFVTFNTEHRPYILLKWCQSANGFLDDNYRPTMLSTPFTQMLSHKLRAEYDAILVGRVTAERDNPGLTTRHWSGPNPKRIELSHQTSIDAILQELYAEKKQSLIVEGGARTHESFLSQGLWDEIRVETSPRYINNGTRAPRVPENAILVNQQRYDGNVISTFRRWKN